MDRDELFIAIAFGAVLFVAAVLAVMAAKESKREQAEWQRFSAAHRCVIVERSPAMNLPSTGFDNKGNATFGNTYIPERAAWKCDDGVTYWRDR